MTDGVHSTAALIDGFGGLETGALSHDDVHVWSAPLDEPDYVVLRLRALLNDDERARADRFKFVEGRHQFTIGRGLLRLLLAHYLRRSPHAIAFQYNAYGKPMVAGEDSLQFNLSHSGKLVLFAIARDRDVGIDVETIRPDFATDGIAERFFAPAEVSALRAVPEDLRVNAFFSCWTRKEAYIKARGRGLSIPLGAFEVSLAPDVPPALLATHDDPLEAGLWSLHALDPGPGYAGALVVAGASPRIAYGTWSGAGGPSFGAAPSFARL